MKPSSQLRWQLKQRAAGRCRRCGDPSQWRAECDRCAKSRKRHPLKSEWARVDWRREGVREVAARLGVTVNAARWRKKKAALKNSALPSGGKGV